MKVAFAFLAILVVCASAQEAGSSLKAKFKSLRHLILAAAEQNKLPVPKAKSWKNRDSCLEDEYMMVPRRLMDWFHVLKAIHEKTSDEDYYEKHVETFAEMPGECSIVFKWFFQENDANKDNLLDLKNELEDILSIPTEKCLKPFFRNCDKNKDGMLSLDETCACFNSVEPPCSQAMRHYNEKKGMMGRMKPACDEDGFYKSRQCHENYCWCVDRFNRKVEGTEARGLVECPDNTDPSQVIFTGEEEKK